jgi:hypothetical protein
MTAREIIRRRLFNQRVSGTLFSSPVETVRRLGAVQAQDYRAGLWAVGLRTKGADEPAVERALADRTIVRTWPMRGTLHIVAAEDVRELLPLLTPRMTARAAGRHRQLGLERSAFLRSRKLFEKALQGGGQLTRDQMYGLLRDARIPPDGQRGIHILQQLAQDGILCFGPRQGKQQTFVLLDEWIPRTSPRPREEVLADLAWRYFSSHGPATVKDFAWWSGLPAADARRALESASSRLVRESADGSEYWVADVPPARGARDPAAVLLPPFDEFLVAYKDRSPTVDPAQAKHLPSLLSPTIMVKGRIVGTWTRTLAKAKAVIVPRFFGRPGSVELRAVEEAARRYGTFLGVAAEMK